jgi:hypothetical protein
MLRARREVVGAMDLEAILTLAGRLDDEAGFDAPRQRFRRYLREHVTQVTALGGFIESCQNVPGDQHHRALQDLVVSLGRFLGFDVTYGAYQSAPDAPGDHGSWRSRSRLQVLVHVATDAPHAGVDALARSHAASASTSGGAGRTCGLCVVTPASGGPATLQGERREAHLDFPISIAGTATLVSLAEVVAAGRLTHDDVVRVFEHEMPIEFVIDLLDRSGQMPSRPPERAAAVAPQPAPAEGPSYWLATLAGDLDAEPEVFLRLVVAGRHLFGVPAHGADTPSARPGDSICFHIPGKGVVGHARVQALANGHAAIRSPHRFRQLLQLDALSLHLDAPLPLDSDTQLRLRTVPWRGARPSSTLIRMSPESYWTLTRT